MAEHLIKQLEREMIPLAGPLAPFLIKKQMKDMGFQSDDFPPDKMAELIDKVVEHGIYDESIKPKTKKALKKKILGTT
jgi:hypothetical protein